MKGGSHCEYLIGRKGIISCLLFALKVTTPMPGLAGSAKSEESKRVDEAEAVLSERSEFCSLKKREEAHVR